MIVIYQSNYRMQIKFVVLLQSMLYYSAEFSVSLSIVFKYLMKFHFLIQSWPIKFKIVLISTKM